ncbi:hypothetical protein SEA_PRAIRIE_78 [Arthrobacter phage Prairie]|uniref:Uncharacterized protein n=1 Tax=Arthrobacter phage Prairie TaxID=2816463 RepID=A0A8A5LKE3_9CAUD|nr:hypothetical protein SEA_PRAIRIE_78 [Arthrobacter phage Prairie]
MSETPTTDKYGFPAVPCSRCAGRERMEEYLAVDAGRCFKCNGERVVVVDRKAKAAKEAYLAARVQVVTVADLEVGQTVSLGGTNTIVRWIKIAGIREDQRNGGLLISSTRGETISTPSDYPARLYVPTDVAPYLEGL